MGSLTKVDKDDWDGGGGKGGDGGGEWGGDNWLGGVGNRMTRRNGDTGGMGRGAGGGGEGGGDGGNAVRRFKFLRNLCCINEIWFCGGRRTWAFLRA